MTGEEASDISARLRFENEVDVVADVQAKLGDTLYSAYVSTRMHPYQEMAFHGEGGFIRLTAPFKAVPVHFESLRGFPWA